MPRSTNRPDFVPANPAMLGHYAGGGAEQRALAHLIGRLDYDPHELPPPPLLDPDALRVDADRLSSSLPLFVADAWRLVEPSTYIHNWHIDAICEHLAAVTSGCIRDLLITMPPRHSKSLIVSVLWPTWEWTLRPSYRWVFASYAFGLSVRDSVKRRKILKSLWYEQRWGRVFSILKEQDTKARYENDHHGFMLASSVGGSNTGEGGERICVDDPHNTKKGESETVRKDTVDWYNIVMSTRRNSEASARIVVQQRVHEADVAGDIIEKGGYVHLNLPTEFDPRKRCFTKWTVTIAPDSENGLTAPLHTEHTWSDPRTADGQLLNPPRFNHDQNEKAKIELGDYQYAAQHGQDPAPPKGTIIKAEWFRYYGPGTSVEIPDFTQLRGDFTPLLSLDCTFKKHDDTDYVCGLVWAQRGADLFLLPVCIHERLSFTGTVEKVVEFVGGQSLDRDKPPYPGIYPFVKVKLVEDKANGTAVLDTLQHQISGMIPFEPGSDSKEGRLQASSWRFRAGNVYLPCEAIAPWIAEYRYELCAFPKAKRDDYVDATSQAILFIGGDLKSTGAPVIEDHTSRWIGVGTAMMDSDGDGRYGEYGGSRWRPY